MNDHQRYHFTWLTLASLGLLFFASLLSSCSEEPRCGVAGGTQQCWCANGQNGAQTCGEGGAWNDCVCEPGTADAWDASQVDPGVAPPDAAEPPDDGKPDLPVAAPDSVEDVPPDTLAAPDGGLDAGARDAGIAPDGLDVADGSGGCDDDEICDPGESLECPGCRAVSVAAGGRHSCAARADGSVWCWGSNMEGQLGVGMGSLEPEPAPIPVPGLTGIARVGAGGGMGFGGRTCAVDDPGDAWCWGDGFGDTPSQLALTDVVAVAPASTHACALLDGGAVWCWGDNEYGQLGVDSLGAPVATPAAVPGMDSGVTAVTTGDSGTPDCIGPCTGGHTCALRGSSVKSIWCWGSGGGGQLGDGNSLASTAPIELTSLVDPISVSAGGESVGGDKGHTCAALADGTAWCWGNNWAGQLGNGNEVDSPAPVPVGDLSDVTAVVTGSIHSCALHQDRTVSCWGHNYHGQLGTGGNLPSSSPVPVAGLSHVLELAAGKYHNCARLEDGSLRCWGLGDMGQLGHGSPGSSPGLVTPVGF